MIGIAGWTHGLRGMGVGVESVSVSGFGDGGFKKVDADGATVDEGELGAGRSGGVSGKVYLKEMRMSLSGVKKTKADAFGRQGMHMRKVLQKGNVYALTKERSSGS